MAEIHVVEKKFSIWPWMVGLLVVAILIWILFQLFEIELDDEPPTVRERPAAGAPPAPGTAPARSGEP